MATLAMDLSRVNSTDSIYQNVGTRPEDLKGLSAVAYKIALLAPKLIFSGAGWVIGAGVGGTFGMGVGATVGAGVGDAIGTMIGCGISLAIEIMIRKYLLNDPSLQAEGAMWKLTKDRTMSALILSTGSLFGGMVFSSALTYIAPLVSSNLFVQALITGLVTSGAFALGMTCGRAMYTISAYSYLSYLQASQEKMAAEQRGSFYYIEQATSKDENLEFTLQMSGIDDSNSEAGLIFESEDEPGLDLVVLSEERRKFALDKNLELSWANLKNDIELSLLIILPAQIAFVGTSLPLFGTTWLLGTNLAALKGAAAVAIGGIAGSIVKPAWDLLSRQWTPVTPIYIPEREGEYR